MSVICGSTITVLVAISTVLGWIVHHQKQAMDAQKVALDATKATVDALKTQSDLRIEPLMHTINSKDGVIQALETQVLASTERRALAEEMQRAYAELNQRMALSAGARTAPNEGYSADLLHEVAAEFFNFGYYLGVANVGAAVLTIQTLTFTNIEKQNLPPLDFAITAAAHFWKNAVLFIYRERHRAIEQSVERVRLAGVKLDDSILAELNQLSEVDHLARDNGLTMDPEVEALSAMQGVPFDPKLFKSPKNT